MTTLNDAILSAVDSRLAGLHACLPARVEKYDYKTQKADVKPLLQKPYAAGAKPLPVIASVPVMWPRGGGAGLCFPLVKGDGVLLVFSERSLETWLGAAQGTDADPGDPRRFDLSDAIAIPGLNPFTVPGLAEDADSVWLNYGKGKIKIDKGGNVSIQGAKVAMGSGSNELVDMVSQLCGYLKGLGNTLLNAKTPTFIGPQPLATALPDFTAMVQNLTSLQSKIDGIKGKLS